MSRNYENEEKTVNGTNWQINFVALYFIAEGTLVLNT